MKPSCQFCIHYSELTKEMGECRRKPPMLTFYRKLFNICEITVFPKVKRNHWCGKHKEKTQ